VDTKNTVTSDKGQTRNFVRKGVRREQQVKSGHEPQEGLHTKTN